MAKSGLPQVQPDILQREIVDAIKNFQKGVDSFKLFINKFDEFHHQE